MPGPAGCVGWPALTTNTHGGRIGYVVFDNHARMTGYCNGVGGCWSVGDCQLSGTWVGESYTGQDQHGQPTAAVYQQVSQGLVKCIAPLLIALIPVAAVYLAIFLGVAWWHRVVRMTTKTVDTPQKKLRKGELTDAQIAAGWHYAEDGKGFELHGSNWRQDSMGRWYLPEEQGQSDLDRKVAAWEDEQRERDRETDKHLYDGIPIL